MGRYEIKDKNPHACHSAAVKVVAAERNLQDEGEEVAAWATGPKTLNRSDKGLLHKPGKAQSIFPLDIRKPV